MTVPASIVRDTGGCRDSHRDLLATLGDLDHLDPTRPSRLPGWSVGHILTHLARNADSHVDMLEGRPQYPSLERRNDDIDTGADRDADTLVADLTESINRLETAWDTCGNWDFTATTLSGTRPGVSLPLLRWREVEVHRVDLALGDDHDSDLAAMNRAYVRIDLHHLEMMWRARRPMGLTPLPAAVLAEAPHRRLGWFMGRVDIDGVEPAGMIA